LQRGNAADTARRIVLPQRGAAEQPQAQPDDTAQRVGRYMGRCWAIWHGPFHRAGTTRPLLLSTHQPLPKLTRVV
jgi:hypothetical protein